MNKKNIYSKLIQKLGIIPSYKDAFGHIHDVPFQTQILLLEAMGFNINDQNHIHKTSTPDKENQKSILPSVIIHNPSLKKYHIPLKLPQNTTIHWSLESKEILKKEKLFIKKGICQSNKFELPDNLELGYYKLTISTKNIWEQTTLIVVPNKCYTPNQIKKRIWGLSIQLYAIRSFRNWGIGDFTDLLTLVKFSAKIGANIIGINPLHALYPEIPEHASPYSPSSRKFLNTLYIDVEAIPEFKECRRAQSIVQSPEFQSQLKYLRTLSIIDYTNVHKLKHKVLSIVYDHFYEHHIKLKTKRAHTFYKFKKRNKKTLEQQSLFETLHENFYQQNTELWSWPTWPKTFHYYQKNKTIQNFISMKKKRIMYFQYLQWIANSQLFTAKKYSKKLGLNIGLYQDIAVGTDIGGCEVWSQPHLYGLKIKIGCPPDLLNQKGQDWGLPPWNPIKLREMAYEPFSTMLQANMRHAGAVRLDHVMGLMRLFWVPINTPPTEGGYVSYPLQDLLSILALESQRNKCLVIGEDLGTVPETLRETLQKHNILSYRVMLLETNPDGSFISPKEYPQNALTTFSTHDLPTLHGFWEGRDLEIYSNLNLYPNKETYKKMLINRIQQRINLMSMIQNKETNVKNKLTTVFAEKIQLLLSNSPCYILMIQIEDILGTTNQINIPGTTHQYPNWRHRIPLELEIWTKSKQIHTFFSLLSKSRS